MTALFLLGLGLGAPLLVWAATLAGGVAGFIGTLLLRAVLAAFARLARVVLAVAHRRRARLT